MSLTMGMGENIRNFRELIGGAFALVVVFALAACSNSTPEVRQNSPAPMVSASGITIHDLDASVDLTGSCQDVGKLDKGFELQLNGSTWIPKQSVACTNGQFRIRVEKIGREMQFQNRIRATKTARVRRSSITGKTSESDIAVRYIPESGSGGVADGGGVTTANGQYILRGSFNAANKDSGAIVTSTDSKFKMMLSRDKDRL